MNLNSDQFIPLLLDWLSSRIPEGNIAWLRQKQELLSRSPISESQFLTSFSSVPRFVGKGPLQLSDQQIQDANELVCGWRPVTWTKEDCGRIILLLTIPPDPVALYNGLLRQAFESADLGETIAFQKALPLLPQPKCHLQRALTGPRSNIQDVVEAVAHHNPYPAAFFDELSWNQMILKLIFINSPLSPVFDLDKRANKYLKSMLIDYARERWAANRTVSPELWRCVGAFLQIDELPIMRGLLQKGTLQEKYAAILALRMSGLKKSQSLLTQYNSLERELIQHNINWETLLHV